MSLLAYHFDEQLINGIPFEKSLEMEYFDSDFYSLCLYGIQNDDFLSGLEDYMSVTEEKMNHIIGNVSRVMQIISYGFVALVIMTAYRILMLPLEMINTL